MCKRMITTVVVLAVTSFGLNLRIVADDEVIAALGFGPGDGWAVLYGNRCRGEGVPDQAMKAIAAEAESFRRFAAEKRSRLRGFGFTSDGGCALTYDHKDRQTNEWKGGNGLYLGMPQGAWDCMLKLRGFKDETLSLARELRTELDRADSTGKTEGDVVREFRAKFLNRAASRNRKFVADLKREVKEYRTEFDRADSAEAQEKAKGDFIRQQELLMGIKPRAVVREFAFGPDDGWIIIYREGSRILYQYDNIPQSLVDFLQELDRKKASVCGVGITPKGGWAVIFESNAKVDYQYKDIPNDAAVYLKTLFPQKERKR